MPSPGFLTVVGSLVGLCLAVGTHWLTLHLQVGFPKAIKRIGLLLLTVILYFGTVFWIIGIRMLSNPMASMGAAWKALGVSLLLLLIVSLSLGTFQARRWKLPFWQAAGRIGSEAGALVLTMLFLNELQFPLADLLRGGDRETSIILESYSRSRDVLSGADLSLTTFFILLNLAHPLITSQRK